MASSEILGGSESLPSCYWYIYTDSLEKSVKHLLFYIDPNIKVAQSLYHLLSNYLPQLYFFIPKKMSNLHCNQEINNIHDFCEIGILNNTA